MQLPSLLRFSVLIVFIVLWSELGDGFRLQSVGARGQLLCGDKPASDVQIMLYDQDDGPDPDDQLDSGYTDAEGRFELSGSTHEFTPIDPEIRVYHDCNDHGLPCQREWIIQIPNKYIYSGRTPGTFMDFYTMNLEVELEDEDQDCIHKK